jgi:hypothetical protein
MQPIYVAAPPVQLPDTPPPTSPAEISDLLRHLIDIQRDQHGLLRGLLAAQDHGPKWKAFLSRWQAEFPDAGQSCKAVLPAVERAFLTTVKDVTDRLADSTADDLENDFALGEFLDRYGTRLGQLAGIINQLTPLAENAPAPDRVP